jgi:hypothetical protein
MTVSEEVTVQRVGVARVVQKYVAITAVTSLANCANIC